MFRRAAVLIVFSLMAAAAFGGVIRLYLKDGTYQLTTDYKINKDRVSYLSSERGEWEELPLAMVDLARTRKEAEQHDEELKADAKSQAEEDAAERLAVKQVEQIPAEPGVYYIHNNNLEAVKIAESKVVNNRKRQLLKVLSPIPMVPGKSALEIDGDTSKKEISEKRPEFFFRLSSFERFGLVRIEPTKKDSRVVENIELVPVTKEVLQQFHEVETFKKQEGDNVYKIWPQSDLPPGEYAFVEYTEGEQINTQVWDFKIVSK